MKEQWADVVGFEGLYRVSTHGRVRSVTHIIICKNGMKKCINRKFLKPATVPPLGYKTMKLYRESDKTKHMKLVHHLVLEAFAGPRPEGMECRHLDGVHNNNHLQNLCWGTRKQNIEDREKHGGHHRGSDSVKSKLTEADIPIIRERLKNGKRGILTAIGKDYSVDAATIRDIRDGRTWKHVE